MTLTLVGTPSIDDYCEGCLAVVDQEHLPECSVWNDQISWSVR